MSKPKVLTCSCGKAFASTSAMAMHIKAVHKGVEPPVRPQKKPSWFRRLWKWLFGRSEK